MFKRHQIIEKKNRIVKSKNNVVDHLKNIKLRLVKAKKSLYRLFKNHQNGILESENIAIYTSLKNNKKKSYHKLNEPVDSENISLDRLKTLDKEVKTEIASSNTQLSCLGFTSLTSPNWLQDKNINNFR